MNSSGGTGGIGGKKESAIGGTKTTNTKRNPLEGLYTSALETSAGDYDKIMEQYRGVSGKGPNPYTPIAPTSVNFAASPEFSSAMSRYGEMAETGGYSGSDISNIRERGISPIRSIYSNAMRNLDRQRALSGGYSPNYGAVSARMSRDLSSQIGDATTNVNAQIAQMVAEGKRAGAAGQAGLASQQQGLLAEIARQNAANEMRTKELNLTLPLDIARGDEARTMGAIQGQQSLYGTTPALAATFGDQVLQALSQIGARQASGPSATTGGGKLAPSNNMPFSSDSYAPLNYDAKRGPINYGRPAFI